MSNNVVEKALSCLGRGYDVTCDFRLKYCKGEGRLVMLNEAETRELAVPGFGIFENVSVDVKCDKGDRIRYQSDVLEFSRMSEVFNTKHSLPGKIPSGLFNTMFGFNSSSWARDAANTKGLAINAHFILLFSFHIDRYPLQLLAEVRNSVPTTWDPKSLARFIEKYGTHIIVGLGIGGGDLILVRQDHSSKLQASELKKHLDHVGDQYFTGTCSINPHRCKNKESKNKAPEAFNLFNPQATLLNSFSSVTAKDGLTVKCHKMGGDPSASTHCEWLLTVPSMPDAIQFIFVPITSLLKATPGKGYLSHAINIYLRYKPPIADLENFLDFQSHRLWAPIHNDLPLGPTTNRAISTPPALHFKPLGPKLYVNTTQVTVGRHPVTGLRLHLEGMKCNRLAIHLEHLSSIPVVLQDKLDEALIWKGSDDNNNEKYFEAVQWKKFSHICTAPVVYEPYRAVSNASAFIVTGAQLLVKKHGSKKVLHLRLLYSEVRNCVIVRTIQEQGSSDSLQKSNFFSAVSTSPTGNSDKEIPKQFVVDSGVYPSGPPMPMQTQKLRKFVDTTQICKGPQDTPGFWIVTGAKLDMEMGKICLHVKFSLLSFTS